jgi:hypothetical protein
MTVPWFLCFLLRPLLSHVSRGQRKKVNVDNKVRFRYLDVIRVRLFEFHM